MNDIPAKDIVARRVNRPVGGETPPDGIEGKHLGGNAVPQYQAVERTCFVARLHALDSYEAGVNILDPVSGALIDYYGGYGQGPGLLRIPQDILLSGGGEAIVTDDDSNEVEVFAIP